MTLPEGELRRRSRLLRDVVEPIAANVYFAPEAREAYAALGLADFGPSYFASRGGCLGQAPGEVITAAFGVFDPLLVVPAVAEAWSTTDVASMLAARERGAVASLKRILGPSPGGLERATTLLGRAAAAAPVGEGRALYSGLCSLGYPGTPLGDLWRAADLVREHRGDSHVIAWVGHGLDPVQANISTELWWRIPLRSYVRTRGWAEERIDASLADLVARGLVAGESFTPAGEALRGDIELATDRQERPILEAIGDDIDELLGILSPWCDAIMAAKGYPRDPRLMTRP
ncbi:MAG: hypothetical protein GEV08_04650 [Acidimicrobiia bacterium]|nr:hypothetical protein [Acidimicrobiia bacterium]